MKIVDIRTEAWRSVTSGASRALVLVGATCVVFTALAWWDADQTADYQRQARDYVDNGGSTYVISATGYINPVACDNLAKVSGVVSAGAVRQESQGITPIATPQRVIPVFKVSEGFFAVINAPSDRTVAAQTIFDQYGLADRITLTTTAGDLPVLAAYRTPSDQLYRRLTYAILVPGETQENYDECWVKFSPPDLSKQDLLYTTLLSSGAEANQVAISQLNPKLGTDFRLHEMWLARISRLAAYIAAALGMLLTYTVVHLRRLELATALHMGVPKSALVLQGLIETLVWSTPSLLFSTGLLLVWMRLTNASVDAATHGILVLVAGWAGTLLGGMIAPAMSRERQMLRYFKLR